MHDKPDYRYATEKAYEFLIEENVQSFPINIFKIIRQNKWYVESYTKTAEKLGITYETLKKELGNSLGTVAYDGVNYSLLYDDHSSSEVIMFTLTHEIGHIKLEHLNSGSCISIHQGSVLNISKHEYHKRENEASCFARNVLSPVVLLQEFNLVLDTETISSIFGVTRSAAKMRLDTYAWDISNVVEINRRDIVYRFKEFLCNCFGILGCPPGEIYNELSSEQIWEDELYYYFYS